MIKGKLFTGGVISGFVSDFPPKEPEDIIGYGKPVVLLGQDEYEAIGTALKKAEGLLEFLKREVWNDEDIDEALALIRKAKEAPDD